MRFAFQLILLLLPALLLRGQDARLPYGVKRLPDGNLELNGAIARTAARELALPCRFVLKEGALKSSWQAGWPDARGAALHGDRRSPGANHALPPWRRKRLSSARRKGQARRSNRLLYRVERRPGKARARTRRKLDR